MHAHTHTHRHPHTQAFGLYKAKYTQLKTGSKRPGDLEWIKTHGTENMAGLHWEVIGSPACVLHIKGSGFNPGSVLYFIFCSGRETGLNV